MIFLNQLDMWHTHFHDDGFLITSNNLMNLPNQEDLNFSTSCFVFFVFSIHNICLLSKA